MKEFLLLMVLLVGCIQTGEPAVNKTIEDVTEPVVEEPVGIEPAENTSVAPLPVKNTSNVLTADTVFPEPEFYEFNSTINGSYVVYFFHTESCSACRETYPVIEELGERYPEIIFKNYSIRTGSGSRAYKQFADLYNLSPDKRLVPQVLVNGTIITDRFNIEEKLEPILSGLK